MSQEIHPDTYHATRGGAHAPDFAEQTPMGEPVPAVKPTRQQKESRRQAKDKVVAPKPPAKVRYHKAPPYVYAPKYGMPRFLYLMRCMFGSAHVPVTPNKRERAEIEAKLAEAARQQRVLDLEHMLKILSGCVQFKVAFLNLKGGASKTTFAANIANVISEVTNAVVYLLPATRNPGSTAKKAGVDSRQTTSLRSLASGLDKFNGYKSNSKLITKSPEGTRVIASDHVVAVGDDLDEAAYGNIVRTLDSAADVIVMDTGNEVARGIELSAARSADVLVFTATADMEESLQSMGDTMDSYYSDMGLRYKVVHSIIGISGIQEGSSPSDFHQYAKFKINDFGQQVGSRDFKGSIVGIRHDDYIKKTVVARVGGFSSPTYLDYLEAAVQIYLHAAVAQNVDLKEEFNRFNIDFTETCSLLELTLPNAKQSSAG